MLRSNLSNLNKYVKFDEISYSIYAITIGDSQGSVNRPFIFNIFSDDNLKSCNKTTVSFTFYGVPFVLKFLEFIFEICGYFCNNLCDIQNCKSTHSAYFVLFFILPRKNKKCKAIFEKCYIRNIRICVYTYMFFQIELCSTFLRCSIFQPLHY